MTFLGWSGPLRPAEARRASAVEQPAAFDTTTTTTTTCSWGGGGASPADPLALDAPAPLCGGRERPLCKRGWGPPGLPVFIHLYPCPCSDWPHCCVILSVGLIEPEPEALPMNCLKTNTCFVLKLLAVIKVKQSVSYFMLLRKLDEASGQSASCPEAEVGWWGCPAWCRGPSFDPPLGFICLRLISTFEELKAADPLIYLL